MVGFLLLALVATSIHEDVLDGIFRTQLRQNQEIAGATFQSRFTYVETDLKTGNERVVECERLVRMRRYEEQSYECSTVRVNGRELEGREREREIGKLRSMGLTARTTRMPFFYETRNEYTYRVTGRDTWQGMTVWNVLFEPVRPSARHVRGSARVLCESFDVVSMEFLPCNLPFVVTAAQMGLEYGRVQGYWLPVRFWMEMDLRLKILVEVMRRRIRVEDRYFDYQLIREATTRPPDQE